MGVSPVWPLSKRKPTRNTKKLLGLKSLEEHAFPLGSANAIAYDGFVLKSGPPKRVAFLRCPFTENEESPPKRHPQHESVLRDKMILRLWLREGGHLSRKPLDPLWMLCWYPFLCVKLRKPTGKP